MQKYNTLYAFRAAIIYWPLLVLQFILCRLHSLAFCLPSPVAIRHCYCRRTPALTSYIIASIWHCSVATTRTSVVIFYWTPSGHRSIIGSVTLKIVIEDPTMTSIGGMASLCYATAVVSGTAHRICSWIKSPAHSRILVGSICPPPSTSFSISATPSIKTALAVAL